MEICPNTNRIRANFAFIRFCGQLISQTNKNVSKRLKMRFSENRAKRKAGATGIAPA